MFREDYENYPGYEWLAGEVRNHSKRFDKLIEYITRDNRVEKLLDCGAGTGLLATKLLERKYAAPIMNIDVKKEFVDRMKSAGLDVVQGDVRDLPFRDREFEVVTCNEVLEHLKDPGKALSELCRVASKRVIFTIPCGRSSDPWHAWLIKCEVVDGWLVCEMERCEGNE